MDQSITGMAADLIGNHVIQVDDVTAAVSGEVKDKSLHVAPVGLFSCSISRPGRVRDLYNAMMPLSCKQTHSRLVIWVILLSLAPGSGCLWAQPSTRLALRPDNQWTRQLQSECRQLTEVAVHRPYGLAWPATQPADRSSTATPAVDLSPSASPAAGLVLALAAAESGDEQLANAARLAAYGLAAAQQTNGRIPAIALFGASAGNHEPPATIADRSPTIGALGLFLILHDRGLSDERLHRATSRALFWLLRQQTSTGGWPGSWPDLADQKTESRRVLRLDSPDFRNATLALYLAGDCLGDAAATRAAGKSIDLLLRVRFATDLKSAAGLWAGIHQLSGEPFSADPQAGWIDLRATSDAIQTLICAALMSDRADAAEGVDLAVKSLLQLPHDPPTGWERYYNPDTADPIATTRPADVGGPFTPPVSPAVHIDPAIERLSSLLRSAAALRTVSREEYKSLLSAHRSLRLRIALALCGLDETPFALDFPLSRPEIQTYLQDHAEWWRKLSQPPPDDLAGRIQRIYWLLNRIQIEELAGQS